MLRRHKGEEFCMSKRKRGRTAKAQSLTKVRPKAAHSGEHNRRANQSASSAGGASAGKTSRCRLCQADVAKRIGEKQQWIAAIEAGQRRISVVEFIALAKAIGFDPGIAVNKIAKVRQIRTQPRIKD
jgi:transcriptional regulator with XRE-family HTH domain